MFHTYYGDSYVLHIDIHITAKITMIINHRHYIRTGIKFRLV